MKTNRFSHLITAALGLAAFSTAGCSEKEKTADMTATPASDASTTPAPAPAASAPVANAAAADTASAKWIDIKDCTYDTRAQFFAGLKALEARVDGQVAELTAKRAAMPSTTDTKDWDFAMKEMTDSRAYLTSMGEELGKATPDTWNQEKDKVGQAWVRTQDAYGKVKASTTL
jgi:hypothetical protein